MAFQNRQAFGNIYTIPTTPIDNIANRLYKEQQIRDAKQQQDIKGMDDMFSKNVSGVRDEDIPEIAESYNKWKTAKINLYKNPKSKNRIQDELAAQREMANTFQKIGNSKQMLKTLQENGKRVAAKPDDHTDDAPSLIASTNGVPTSQFGTLLRADPNGEIDPATGKVKMVGFDPSDYNTYVDRGNVKNWQPIMKNAIGQLRDVTPISEEYKDNKGLVLGQKVTPIKATASPTSYMANMSQYVYSGVGRVKHFNNSFKDSYTDDNATKIATEYYNQAKNNPLWKQAWGENGLAIPPEALANPNTRILALNSMEYALNNPPQLGTPRNVPNPANVAKSKEDLWMKHNRIVDQQKSARIRLNNEGRHYEIDNIPKKLKEDVQTRKTLKVWNQPPVEEQVIDITDYPSSYKDDILGSKKDKYGDRINKPIIENGRELLRVTPEGYEGDNGYKVTDKDVLINTNNRTVKLEKPIGTGKADVRGNEPLPKVKSTTKSGLPVFHN